MPNIITVIEKEKEIKKSECGAFWEVREECRCYVTTRRMRRKQPLATWAFSSMSLYRELRSYIPIPTRISITHGNIAYYI